MEWGLLNRNQDESRHALRPHDGRTLGTPEGKDANSGWASGAWFIGPDGATLAQMPSSTQKSDSREYVLVQDIPLK